MTEPAPIVPVLTASPTDEQRERLSRVKYVFTDLDGTMLNGPSILRDSAGHLSAETIEALVELEAAGVELVINSGRNRSMVQEDARLLGLRSYIAEMGGIVMLDLKAADWRYCTGEMPYDPSCGLTPHQVIEGTGVLERILERWPGRIEYHNDMGDGPKYREVTVTFRGDVPDDEALAMVEATGLALSWTDNGYVPHISKPTSLELPAGTCRSLHVIPKGLDKGYGVAQYVRLRGIDPAECLSIGDAPADFLTAPHVGTFVFMENGLKHPDAAELVARTPNAWLSCAPSVDGWCAAMRAIAAAKK